MAGIIILDDPGDIASYSREEMEEYADWLGINLYTDQDYLWIVRVGMETPLPAPWRTCVMVEEGEAFYFNMETGASVWEHPSDTLAKQLLEEERAKPCLVGILTAVELPSGAVELSVWSIGGDRLVTVPGKFPRESPQVLTRRVAKEIGQKIQLMLPDGTLLARDDTTTLISELLGVNLGAGLVRGHVHQRRLLRRIVD